MKRWGSLAPHLALLASKRLVRVAQYFATDVTRGKSWASDSRDMAAEAT
jgi:hypothetical protein